MSHASRASIQGRPLILTAAAHTLYFDTLSTGFLTLHILHTQVKCGIDIYSFATRIAVIQDELINGVVGGVSGVLGGVTWRAGNLLDGRVKHDQLTR